MRNFDEFDITAAVIARLDGSTSPRVKKVSTSLVRHLHDFVRDVEPNEQEWMQAIEFLTRTGQWCTRTRQEFILLSDTLGVSMLVDAINHRRPGGATETTILGPFYLQTAPEVACGARIAELSDGPPLLIEGSVKTADGKPVVKASVDIWHADAAGFYDVQKSDTNLGGRARVRTDDEGHFWVHGVVPAAYPIPNDGPVGDMLKAQGRHPYRPAHVHFLIAAEGYETLVTHLFLSESDYLDSDAVFGVKDSLVAEVGVALPGTTPYGAVIDKPVAVLRRDFVLAAATAAATAAANADTRF